MIKIDIKTELNNIDKFFDNLSTSELEEMLIRNGAEDDRYKSIFDNLTDEEFEDILNKCGFKYRKVDKGKGGLYIDSNFEGK